MACQLREDLRESSQEQILEVFNSSGRYSYIHQQHRRWIKCCGQPHCSIQSRADHYRVSKVSVVRRVNPLHHRGLSAEGTASAFWQLHRRSPEYMRKPDCQLTDLFSLLTHAVMCIFLVEFSFRQAAEPVCCQRENLTSFHSWSWITRNLGFRRSSGPPNSEARDHLTRVYHALQTFESCPGIYSWLPAMCNKPLHVKSDSERKINRQIFFTFGVPSVL